MRNDPGRRNSPLLTAVPILLLVVALLAAETAWAAQFLSFRAVSGPQGTELLGGGKVIMRLRPGMRVNGGAAAVAAELNRLAFAGLKPEGLSIVAVPGGARIMAGTQPLLTVDAATAKVAGSSPAGLAATWVSALREVLAIHYVVLEPSDRMQVPLGETRQLRWGGTAAADITFTTTDPEVAGVELSPDGRSLTVQGAGLGKTTLTAALDGATTQLPVEVKAWAVRVPPAVVAEVTAPPLPADDLRRTVRNAVLHAARPAPGASIALEEPSGAGSRYSIGLRATGQDCFEVSTKVAVELRTIARPASSPQEMLISNMPEKITENCTLLRERLVGQSPVRLLWHHVNRAKRPLRFAVRLVNRSEQPARLHFTDAACGPHHDEIGVGHAAMMRFLALYEQGEGYVLNLPGGRMLDLYDVRLPEDKIVSGVGCITPLQTDDLLLEVVADEAWPTDAYFPPVPDRLRQDPPLTPYRFEAEKQADLTYEVGGAWTFFSIGREPSVNLQGQKLHGDYGVRYTITIKCKNPTTESARCTVSLRAGGGVARASYYLYNKLQETGLMRPSTEHTIDRFDLAPNEERVLKLITIPESGSNYPITLTVRNQ